MKESTVEIDARGPSEILAEVMDEVIRDLQRGIADEIAKHFLQQIFPPIGLTDWLESNRRVTDRERREMNNQRGNA